MPFPTAKPEETYQGIRDAARKTIEDVTGLATIPTPTDIRPPEGAPLGRIRFTQRVRVVDGFQYRGTFDNVPDWVERTWLNYDGHPPDGYDVGPSIKLPDGTRVRMQDWLVLEEVDGQSQMRVYTDAQMKHFFHVEETL